MAEDREPIGDVLGHLAIHALVPGDTAVEAFVLIKLADAAGNTAWSYRTTQPPNREELLGALVVQVEILRRELADQWESGPADSN